MYTRTIIRSVTFRVPTGPLVAIAWLFANKGLMLGNWISRIPAVADRHDLDRGGFGTVLSSLHACFSLGSLIGPATGALFAAFEIAAFPQMLATGTISMVVLLIISTHLVPDAPHTGREIMGPRLTFPSRIVLPLAMIAFTCALVDESVADWGALYLDQDLGSMAAAAIGYPVLATMMLIGRVFGDRIVRQLGAPMVVKSGVLLSSNGLAFGLIVNPPWSMFVAFCLIGLGFSAVLPVVYRAVGTMPDVRPGQAVACVATTFYLAFLVGPLVIGWVTDFASLLIALALVAIAMLAIVALAPSLRAPQRPSFTPSS